MTNNIKSLQSDDPNGVRRYDLKGYERGMRMTRQGCTRIAHALHVVGPMDLMIRQMVPAFRMVLNRHPKMRAIMSKHPNEPMTSYIPPQFTSDAQVEKLVTIINQHSDDDEPSINNKSKSIENLRQLMEDVCNETVDRTIQYPYCLMVHTDATLPANEPSEGSLITIVLFSDHTFGDGYSGMIVLNDLLVNLSLLIKLAQCTVDISQEHMQLLNSQLEEQRQQLPLRSSLYDQMVGTRPTLPKLCLENVINVAGRMMMPWEIRKFEPLLPSREDLMDMTSLPFPVNKSYCLLESGTKENLESALATCRKEQVTLNGAIIACVMMAHVKAKYPDLQKVPNKTHFKIHFDVDYNMRRRVKSPFPELTVGSNVDVASLDRYASRGVDLSRRFWDVARNSKQMTDAGVSSFLTLTQMIFCHHNLNPTNTKWNVTMPKGVVRDVNLSNLGRYPFPTVHDLGDLGAIRVKGLHLYNSMPHIGYNAIVFVTSTEHLDYAMSHKLSDGDGAILFQYIVKSIEAISSIGRDETMLEACERIFAEMSR